MAGLGWRVFRDHKDMIWLAYELISIPKSNSPLLQSQEWGKSNVKLGVGNVRRICFMGL